MAKSIIQTEKECFICRHMLGDGIDLPPRSLEEHHIFNAANRKLSEQYGLKVWLCINHHREGMNAVHRHPYPMILLKRIGQQAFEEKYGHEEFMKIFGRNYLEEYNESDQDNT